MPARARELKMPVERLNAKVGKQNWHNLARQEERNFLASEYIRSRVYLHIQEEITHAAIREVYDRHPEQFRTVDKGEWQDLFIVPGPNHPTTPEAPPLVQRSPAGGRAGPRVAG